MTSFLFYAISFATVLLYGCVGEIITEKVGHLNLGIPGIMCIGTAGGCIGVSLYMGIIGGQNPSWLLLLLISIIFSLLFSAFLGGIYALLTVTLRCNQNITGLAITIFGTGATDFLMTAFVDKTYFQDAGKIFARSLPFAESLGGFGKVVLGHGILVYLAIAISILAALFLNKTRMGLHLRAVGESPATADAAGINVTAYKYGGILVGSGIAGLGGFYYIMGYIGGNWEMASTIEAFGWLAIALVIFVLWKPQLGIVGSILFGACFIVVNYIANITPTQKEIVKILPYVVTVVVLIVTSIFDNKENQPPASLGLSYFREDR